MRTGLTAVALEAREALRTMQEKKAQAPVGAVVVSGMLAEQLAREAPSSSEILRASSVPRWSCG